MAKIQSTGKQYLINLPKDLLRILGWKKGTEVYISKDPDKKRVYIEEIKK